MKRVAAVRGSRVCGRAGAIWIDGKVVARRAATDGRGLPLPRWQGCRVLRHQDFFLLSFHPRAFDSRYFGPIGHGDVIGRAVLLWPR